MQYINNCDDMAGVRVTLLFPPWSKVLLLFGWKSVPNGSSGTNVNSQRHALSGLEPLYRSFRIPAAILHELFSSEDEIDPGLLNREALDQHDEAHKLAVSPSVAGRTATPPGHLRRRARQCPALASPRPGAADQIVRGLRSALTTHAVSALRPHGGAAAATRAP